MIGRISGTLTASNPPQILVDCNGVGYEIDVPMNTFYELPPLGQPVLLFTHLSVREDAHQLFGFGSFSDRAAFRQLIKISGVGARTALSILSGMTVGDLAQAISQQDAARLVKVPGIGKKTAERLLLELKGKIGASTEAPGAIRIDNHSDVQNALIALGYSDKEASAAVKGLAPDVGVSDGIKLALKALSKA